MRLKKRSATERSQHHLPKAAAALLAGIILLGSSQQHVTLDSPPTRNLTSTTTKTSIIVEPSAVVKTMVTVPEHYSCLDKLPKWFKTSSPEAFREAILEGSEGLTDKVHIRHAYQHMYHRYMRDIAFRACEKGNTKLKILEIGLGCHPRGGMVRGTPGGSAKAWRHIFPVPVFDLDLHVMEYDEACGKKWAAKNKEIASVHFGDQGSKDDLLRVVSEAGGGPFDVIIDDGSHINEHQILSAEVLTEFLGLGGVLILEDIHSACKSWSANLGTHHGTQTGGSEGCMVTSQGEPTVFAKLVEWQKKLILKEEPIKDIAHIDITFEAAVLQKYIER